jgi:hypothetical protein
MAKKATKRSTKKVTGKASSPRKMQEANNLKNKRTAK